MPKSTHQDPSVTAQYDGWARVYDLFWRRYMNRTLPVAGRTAAVAPAERVLDLACGTGELLRRLAAAAPEAELTGVDLAPNMVDQSRRKLANEPNVQVEQADAHDLPYADDTFDVVVCANTFHYFTHPEQVLGEVRRVLGPEGRLVLLDWCRDFWTCQMMDVVLQYVDPAYETCYTRAELTSLLERASFEVPDAFRYRFDVVWGMMVVVARPAFE